jgi:hypothetical protein
VPLIGSHLSRLSLALCLISLPLAACIKESRPAPAAAVAAASPGRIVARYEPATLAENRREAAAWKKRRLLEEFAEAVNEYIRLPVDISLIAKECGEPNAFYDPDTRTMEMCYELAASGRVLFISDGNTPAETEDKLHQSAVGTLYHELGHALISVLDLHFTGREEDVADQLAAFVLTSDTWPQEYLFTVAETYAITAERQTRLQDLPLNGIHSLDAQRATNFLCYIYGSDTRRFADLVQDGFLPAERAEYCEDEYEQLVKGWYALLQPHLKAPAAK